MKNYTEIIRTMVKQKNARKKRFLEISEQLKVAMDITDHEIELLYKHDMGINFPSLQLAIHARNFLVGESWSPVLALMPIGETDKPPLQWSYVPNDDTLADLVKEIAGSEKMI